MNDNHDSLKDKVLSGFLWLGSATFLSQVVSWVSTIIVIRLLSPSDYGLLAMSDTFIFIITTISTLGISSSLIQAEELKDKDIQYVFGVVLVALCLCASLCYVLAPIIASFYSEHRLILIVRVMVINIILICFYIVPQSIVLREMNFRLKAKIDMVSQLGASFVTLGLAFGGFGVWALIFGIITLNAIKMISFNLFVRYPKCPLFSYRKSKNFITYGATVTGDRLLYSLYNQIDRIIIGKLLGEKILGIYAVSMNLASMPSDKILPIVNQVSFTSYSRMQSNIERIKRNVLRAIRVVSSLSFPVFFGMASISPEMIPFLLGEQWGDAVVPFALLCMIIPLKVLSSVLPPVVFALGRPNVNLINMVMACFLMAISFVVGANWGILGVCFAWLLMFPIVFYVTTLRCLNVIGLPFNKIISEMIFPSFASLIMFGFVTSSRRLYDGLSSEVLMAFLIITGVVIYSLLVLIFNKDKYLEIIRVLR